jgi:hypothetical protein
MPSLSPWTAKGARIMTFPSFHDPTHLYFITASIIGWKHLFIEHEYARIPLNSLAWLQQQKRILLFAFFILPSHLHVILKPENELIGNIIRQFGSFTAHEILKKLEEQDQIELLNLFQKNKRDQRHEHSIWQDIQAKNVYSMKFFCGRSWSIFTRILLQKIGSQLKIEQIIHTQVQDIMIMGENRLLRLQIYMNG